MLSSASAAGCLAVGRVRADVAARTLRSHLETRYKTWRKQTERGGFGRPIDLFHSLRFCLPNRCRIKRKPFRFIKKRPLTRFRGGRLLDSCASNTWKYLEFVQVNQNVIIKTGKSESSNVNEFALINRTTFRLLTLFGGMRTPGVRA